MIFSSVTIYVLSRDRADDFEFIRRAPSYRIVDSSLAEKLLHSLFALSLIPFYRRKLPIFMAVRLLIINQLSRLHSEVAADPENPPAVPIVVNDSEALVSAFCG